MATRNFTGTDGNWANTANWSGGAIPVDGDDVIFPGNISQSLTTNLDRTGDTAGDGLNLNSIYVHPDFGGEIGTAASPLKCLVGSAATSSIRHYGSQPFYYNAEQGTGSNDTKHIHIVSRNASNAMTIGGDENIENIFVARGGYTISNTGTILALHQSFVFNRLADTVGTIEAGANQITLINMTGGILNQAEIATGAFTVINGGKLIFTDASGAIFFIGPNGILDHRGGGTITEIHNMGRLIFSNSSLETTVTSLYRHSGSHIDYDSHLVTITNDYPGGV